MLDNDVVDEPIGSAQIYDGMVLLQQLEKVPLATFGDVSEYILRRILSHNALTTYFVTDQYIDGSIKSYERERRAQSGTIRINIERRAATPETMV